MSEMIYTFQLVFIFTTVILLFLGFFRLGSVFLRLPRSEFKTIFGLLSVAYLLLAPLVFGFALAAIFDLAGSDWGRQIQIYWGIPGIFGIGFLMFALFRTMKYLGGEA